MASSHTALSAQLIAQLRLKDLQFVLKVAELRSLSAAAQALRLTQPAASRWLRDIEQLFRAHLFTRDRLVGMTPTPLGGLVIERARALLSDVSGLSAEIEAHQAGRGMHLVLGVIPYASERLVERLVTTLVTQHAMTLSIVEAATEPLLDGLRQQRLHAAIGRGPLAGDGASGLRMEMLYAQRACLLVHADSALARRPSARLAALADMRWVAPPIESPSWQAIVSACVAAKAPPPRPVVQTSSTKLVHAMVAHNADMVAVLPADIGDDLERRGGVRALPFPASLQMPQIGLIAQARQWNFSHIAAVRNALRTLVAAGAALR